MIPVVSQEGGPPPVGLARPPYELWVGFAAGLAPHLLAIVAGGYGRIVTVLPIAAGLTIVDIAAIAVAGLQLRDDRREKRPSHWLVWAIFAVAGTWVFYAAYIALIDLLVQIFCINQLCRARFG